MVTAPTTSTDIVPDVVTDIDPEPRFLPRADLDRLLALLQADGRTVIGPRLADDAIVYDELRRADDLPIGWTDRQAPGHYRLERTDRGRAFDFAVGPTAWKRLTFPPRVKVGEARRIDGRVQVDAAEPDPPRLAFVGVRACEIAALLTQDRVLAGGPVSDADYVARRAAALVIAVECVTPAATCFCTSMGTGPEVTSGFDLALTELDDGFVVRVGTAAGDFLVHRLAIGPATPVHLEAARAAVAAARASIGDPLPTAGLAERLLAAADSPRWAEIAERCLACTNCTMVCPTCFCTSVDQTSDLAGTEATSDRVWDSCFTLDFARVAGGNFRPRVQDRYRQWLTHKFAGWWEQFGSSGCVGCGRCITWCPVGIDVRAALLAIAPAEPSAPEGPDGPAPAGMTTLDPLSLPVIAARPTEVRPMGSPPATAAPVAARPSTTPSDAIVTAVADVADTRSETADVVTLRLRTDDPSLLAGRPGQFVMASLPAFPAAPISVSRFHPDGFDLTIRAAGPATRALCALRAGGSLAVRGPMGRGWPVEAAHGRDVAIITGGIGLAPLRPLLDTILGDRDRFGVVRLLYGARTPADRLYVDELSQLAGRGDIEVASTVDRAGPEWLGRVGVVTTLFDQAAWDGRGTTAFVCGPERMMTATAEVLGDLGVDPDRIWVTLERHMDCGVGLCGHCQLGPRFVCKDGPVFSLAELGPAFAREGW
jgi:sulfhydrogenase subunit beta (sulfur reductase)